MSGLEIVDPRKERSFLDQYIELRNRHADRLLTLPVTEAETRDWLRTHEIEIRGLADGPSLLGIAILYLDRGGEIAFFVKTPNRGIGSRLLEVIEEVAVKRRLASVWAWVLEDNPAAQHVFRKRGFVEEGKDARLFLGERKNGLKFRKVLEDPSRGI